MLERYILHTPRGVMHLAYKLADEAVLCDIESEGVRVEQDGRRWYDVRPLLDERERSAECIDMAGEAIAYAIARGLAAQHPQQWYLLVLARSGQ